MAKKQGTETVAREEKKEEAKRIRKQNRGNDGIVADWEQVDSDVLRAVIAAVANRSCAIQFGYTRDLGAYYMRIVGDGEAYNEYVRPTEDVEGYIQGITEDFRL